MYKGSDIELCDGSSNRNFTFTVRRSKKMEKVKREAKK
jgi:hypothetical protein